jgi:hypothetical protein
MCFADTRRRNFLRVALNPDRFGEWLEYIPASGAPRVRLLATVQPITVEPVAGREQEAEREHVVVLISSDPHAEVCGQKIGGIANPVHPDRIQRAHDRPGQTYTFDMPVGGNEYAHRLRFSRKKQTVLGTSETQQ